MREGGCEAKRWGRMGHLHTELIADRYRGFFGSAQRYIKARGRSMTQSRWSPRVGLVRRDLRVRLVHSTFPEDLGWYSMWKYHGILRACETS